MRTCPICEQGNLQTRTYGRDMQYKGVNISVEGLQSDFCPACGVEMATPEQLDLNAKVIRNAFIAERERVKHEQNLLTGSEIRKIREQLGITQKQASKIFGGGPTAFAKYEAEDVVQSAGMDKLLRLASEIPAAADWLFAHSAEAISRSQVQAIPQESFTFAGLPAASTTRKTEFAASFADSLTTKLGQFIFEEAAIASCNDGTYADAA